MNRRLFLLGLAAFPLVPSVQPEPPPIETLDDWLNQVVQYTAALGKEATILSADNPAALTVGWLVCTGELQSELFELPLSDLRTLMNHTSRDSFKATLIRSSTGRRDIALALTKEAERLQRYGTLV